MNYDLTTQTLLIIGSKNLLMSTVPFQNVPSGDGHTDSLQNSLLSFFTPNKHGM